MAYPIVEDIKIFQSVTFWESFSPVVDCAPATPFKVSTPYQAGDFVTKVTDDGSVFMVIVAGTAAGSEPAWPSVLGGRVTSNTVTFMRVASERLLDTTAYNSARFKVRADPGGTVLASGSNADGRVEIGFSPPKWATGSVYAAGQQVIPKLSGPNGYVYVCETAGTSHASTEPTWPLVLGDTVTDNTVVWRCLMSDGDVLTNLRVSLPASYTGTLTGWAAGVYQLDIEDTFGNIIPIAVGVATLSAKVAQA